MNATTANVLPLFNEQEQERDTPDNYETICGDLNQEMVDEFHVNGVGPALLEQFVFAVDHLDEMTKTSNFPNNRLLNTADIIAGGTEVVSLFDDYAKRSREISNYGCSVSNETMASIQEFYDLNYLKDIHLVAKTFNRQVFNFTLDGIERQLEITRLTPHHEFGLLRYKNIATGLCTSLPFHLNRILDV